MFSKLFEERDRKVALLVKLGDCLGRSLRENVTLFSIDSQNRKVTYLTEGQKVITGTYEVDKDVTLDDIEVQDSSVFQDGEVFDGYVNEQIHSFVENIHYGDYSDADGSFDNILSLWENRMKLDSIQAQLFEKAQRLESLENIVESDQFQQVLEIRPQLVSFLQENFEKISTVPEIRNAVNLANSVSTAFNFPRLSYEALEEGKSYTLKDGISASIYEMICRQELIKKELLESKKNFDLVWADNTKIINLASMVFEQDGAKLVAALTEALKEVPYLALASKKSLYNTFSNCLAQADGIGVKDKDIQEFASTIFEIKKEAKSMLINSINEKYGVNIQNLKEPASFKSLINTQVVIFEALSRLAPKSSLLKSVLQEMASSLKNKSGVEGIDVNDFVYQVFGDAGYWDILDEHNSQEDTVDLNRLAKEVVEEANLEDSLQEKVVRDEEYPSDETLDDKEVEAGSTATATEEKPETRPENPPEEEEETGEVPEDEGAPKLEKPESQEDMVGSLADIEKLVADLADDITGSEEDDNEEEED